MSADPFARFFSRLPPPAFLFISALALGVAGAIGVLLFEIRAFGVAMPLAVMLSSFGRRKWDLDHGVPLHSFHRWYWEAAGWIIFGVVMFFLIDLLVRE